MRAMARLFGLLLWIQASCAKMDQVASPEYQGVPQIERRSISNFNLLDLVILSTLDGSLQARNRVTGNVLWTLEGSELAEISIRDGLISHKTTSKPYNHGSEQDPKNSFQWLAEPNGYGSLYFFTPEGGLERVPAAVRDLVQRAPFGVIGNVMYTGSTHTVLYAIDIATGEIIQALGGGIEFEALNGLAIDPSRVLMVGATESVLDIQEQLGTPGSTIILRNWIPNSRDEDLAAQYSAPQDSLYITPLTNTTIMALAENDVRPQRWIREAPSMLIDVFDVLQDSADGSLALVRQPEFDLPNSGTEWDLYVVDGYPVVLSGQRYAALLSSAPKSDFCEGKGPDITGVHPLWCQNRRPGLKKPKEVISLLPPAPSSVNYPLLDPPSSGLPAPTETGGLLPPINEPSMFWGLNSQFSLFTVIVNSGIVIVLLAMGYLAAIRGWFPNSRKKLLRASSSIAGVAPVEEKKRKRGARGARGGKRSREKEPPIVVSDTVLGYGSHGTTVFKGKFEDRDVAVKRMLLEFYDVASQEVDILRESDDHPNVVRYYYKYQSDQFLYIALELCPCSLEELVRATSQFSMQYNPLDALRQVTLGLQHLHSLQIVHRDIKPQNILIALPKRRNRKRKDGKSQVETMGVRYVISDFGLCRKLEGEQSSFLPTAAADSVAGTAGWAAPEIISMSSNGCLVGPTSSEIKSVESTQTDNSQSSNSPRLTRAVDIFSMGCLFYYVLSGGKHPFGDPHMRQVNIQQRRKPELQRGGLVDELAMDLIPRMLANDPHDRPNTQQILHHPLFWSDQAKLDFLVKISDRLEHESREEHSDLIDDLEKGAPKVVGSDWHSRFPSLFIDNLGKYRRYHGDRIIDLLRALRNKLHHYNDFTPELVECVGTLPGEFLHFFTKRFPFLLTYVYYYAERHFKDEVGFKAYYAEN